MKYFISISLTIFLTTITIAADECLDKNIYVGRALCLCTDLYGRDKTVPVWSQGRSYRECSDGVRKACDKVWVENKYRTCGLAHPGPECHTQE